MNPQLSVVIPSVNGKPWILNCLERLHQQTAADSLEIIVCDRLQDDATETIRKRFPDVRVEPNPPDTSIPALRWLGMKRARAEIIAVIEDHSVPPPDWAREVIQGHRLPYDIVAGPVENESQGTLFDWAFFLLEYAPFMPPVTAEVVPAAPGVNISYKKSVLPLEEHRFASLWENFLLDKLRNRGARIYLHPAMSMGHGNPFTFREFAKQRYFFSRSFAAMRLKGATPLARLVFGAGAGLVLPVLLLLRLARTVWAKGRNRREFVLALPWMLPLVCCGVVGEVLGAWFGDGGSLQRVK